MTWPVCLAFASGLDTLASPMGHTEHASNACAWGLCRLDNGLYRASSKVCYVRPATSEGLPGNSWSLLTLVLAGRVSTRFAAKALQYGLHQECLDSLLFHVASAPTGPVQVGRCPQSFFQAHRNAASRSVLAHMVFEARIWVIAELRRSLESHENALQKLSPEERSSPIQVVRTRLGWSLHFACGD